MSAQQPTDPYLVIAREWVARTERERIQREKRLNSRRARLGLWVSGQLLRWHDQNRLRELVTAARSEVNALRTLNRQFGDLAEEACRRGMDAEWIRDRWADRFLGTPVNRPPT